MRATALAFACLVACALAPARAGAVSLGPVLSAPGLTGDATSGLHPPDPVVAAGPRHVVHMATGKGTAVYDRVTGALVSGPVPPATFLGHRGVDILDPQVMWDEQSQRYFFIHNWRQWGVGFPEPAGLTYGWTKTSDPTDLVGGWCKVDISTYPDFEDRPKLGDNDTHLIVGTNTFPGGGGDDYSKVITIPKPPNGSQSCPSGPPAGVKSFGTAASPLRTSDGHAAWSPVPAALATASSTGYVVSADNVVGSNELMVWHVNSSGDLVARGELSVPAFGVPPRPTQPPPYDTLDSHDRRLTQAVGAADPGAGGAVGLWTQHTIADPAGSGRAVARWYELLPANCTGDPCSSSTLRQQGEVKDPSHHVFNAAIAPSFSGNEAVINYNVSSATLAPQIRARARQSTTLLGSMGAEELILDTSDSPSDDATCLPHDTTGRESCRWGDAVSAAPDPVDPHAVWGSNQAAGPRPADAPRAHWKTRNFAARASDAPTLRTQSVAPNDTGPGGDGDGVVEPGESFDVAAMLRNSGSAGATSVTGTLASATAGLTVPQPSSAFAGMAAGGGTAANTTPFRAALDSSASCGTPLRLSITLDTAQGRYKLPVDLATGQAGTPVEQASSSTAQAIPDGSTTGASSTITVAGSGTVADVDARVARISHTWIGDVEVELTGPDGTTVVLASRPGTSLNGADNMVATVFDDEATASLDSAAAPYTGRFRPQGGLLSAFDGKQAAGTWRMRVRDLSSGDTGSFEGWSLTRSAAQCSVAAPNQPPTAAFSVSASPVPTGQPVTFTSTSTDSDGTITHAWDTDNDGAFDDGTGSTASKSFADDGTYTVRLRVTDDDGESDVTSREVTVDNRAPAAAFSVSASPVPTNQAVTFTSTSTDSDGTVAAHAWDLDNDGAFDDGTGSTATRSFQNDGSYTVRLRVTDDDGATSTTTQPVTVTNRGPAAAFTVAPSSVLTRQTVTFTSTSSDSDGTIAAHAWDLDNDGAFDDGNGSTAAWTYVNDGTYTARLQVTDDDGATAVTTREVVVENRPPAAGFTVSPAPARTQETVTFTSTSTDADGTITHAWDTDNDGSFDDGSSSTATKQFSAAGSYTVRLRVTDDDNATDVAERTVVVEDRAPVASFSYAPATPRSRQDVTFASTSTDPDRTINAIAWDLDADGDFDDGTGATATRQFPRSGAYTARLRLTYSGTKATTATRVVDVTNSDPVARFDVTPERPVAGLEVTLDGRASADPDGSVAAYAWDLDDDGDFDDGTAAVQRHVFPQAGERTVRLRVTDSEGGTATTERDVAVTSPAADPPADPPSGGDGPPSGGTPPQDPPSEAPRNDPPLGDAPRDDPPDRDPVADTRAPTGAVAVKTSSLRAFLTRGLALRFSTTEPGSLRVELFVDARTARRHRLPGATGRKALRIAAAAKSTDAGRATLRLKSPAAQRRALTRLLTTGRLGELNVTVRLTLRDGAGNERRITRKATLKAR